MASDLTLKIDRARWWVLSTQPFYGQLCMGLADVMDSSIPTACTDGRKIRWNPDFLAGLSDEQTRFVLMHEALHCAHGHFWRFTPGRTVNQACDYAINGILHGINGASMPDGGLHDPRFAGMAEEEILGVLEREAPAEGGGQPGQPGGGGGSGGAGGTAPDPCGDFEAPADGGGGDGAGDGDGQGDGPDGSYGPGGAGGKGQGGRAGAGAGESLREQWERRVIQAAMAGKSAGCGDLPGGLQRVLDRVTAQHIDWRRELADFVRSAVGARNDWARAARRHAWQSVIYPRRRPDDLGRVVFVRDTSGSVDDRVCAEFTGLIAAAMAECNCRGLVIDCDAAIKRELEVGPGDDIPLDPAGGGGTDLCPPFARARDLIDSGEAIAGLVYLTDLDGPEPDPAEVDFPTLWLCTTGRVGRVGRTVRIES